MKVSKVVMIVVALHVVVIGGIFVFEGCSRARVQPPAIAENEMPIGELPPDLDALTPVSPLETNLMVSAPAPLTPAAPELVAPAMPAPAMPAAATYTIKKGDSLWKISRAHGISVAELAQANNLSARSVLQIGQQLTIPATATGGSALEATADPLATAGATETYTVRKGDSLWKIARQHQVSVAALKQANGLSSDRLQIGQQLKLPAAAAAATATATATPTVQAGVSTWSALSEFREPGTYTENGQTLHFVDLNETPAIIARKYGIRTEDLMKANNLTDPRQIHYGQRLVIPVASTPQTAAPAPVTTAAATLR